MLRAMSVATAFNRAARAAPAPRSIVRRGLAGIAGAEFVPPDPDPPRIGAIELLQSRLGAATVWRSASQKRSVSALKPVPNRLISDAQF